MGPYRITSNTTKRGDIWRRLLEMRQARQYMEEEEVLKLISHAKRLLKRKEEIEQAMSTMQQMTALRNLGPMGLLEGRQSRDHKKLSFSRKKRPRPVERTDGCCRRVERTSSAQRQRELDRG